MADTYIEIELTEFCSSVRNTLNEDESVDFVFFLGSGCSLSSGIPTGNDLARAWLARLIANRQDDQEPGSEPSLKPWGRNEFHRVLNSPGTYYAQISQALFQDAPAQQREIERLTSNRFPGHGYALLAKLIAESKYSAQTNIVLTTNFDDLLTDALYLYTHKRPLVLVHENLFDYLIKNRERPLIVKLHGDAHIAPKNQEQDLTDQEDPIKNVLTSLPRETALIFIGYSGLDKSVTRALQNCAESNAFHRGIYWVNDTAPPENWASLWQTRQRNCYWIKHLDFDALMIALTAKLNISAPTLERSRHLTSEHHQVLTRLDHRFSRSTQYESAHQLFRDGQHSERPQHLTDLTAWIRDELTQLDSDERKDLFHGMATEREYRAEMRTALDSPIPHLSTHTAPHALTEKEIEQRILHDPYNGQFHIQRAEILMNRGQFDDARRSLESAKQDRAVRFHPDLLGTEAYLNTLNPEAPPLETISSQFEQAYTLATDHRKNLIRYLIALLKTDQSGTDKWAGLDGIDIWQRGRQILNQYFDLPLSDEDQDKSTWFKALFCTACYYRQTFNSILEEANWPSGFSTGLLHLDQTEHKILSAIAANADLADPESRESWAYDSNINTDEFGDRDELLTELARIGQIKKRSSSTMYQLASTFLSHSSNDKPLVEAVAAELGKRGIVAWLDQDELHAGASLTEQLSTAIQNQATLCVFLSQTALQSDWVRMELRTALDHYSQAQLEDHIKPIYLDDPYTLVNSEPLLQSWLDPTGRNVEKLGIKGNSQQPIEMEGPRIANEIANSIYHSLGTSAQREAIIYIDQRGSTRRGLPEAIPENHRHLKAPALIFRPRAGASTAKETIVGPEWDQLSTDICSALHTAFKGLRWSQSKSLYFSGRGQMSLAWLIGLHFDRSSDAILHCSDERGNRFSNEGWDKHSPLGGGNPTCERNAQIQIAPIPDTQFEQAALIISSEYVAQNALQYLNKTHPDMPIAWIESPNNLSSSEQLKSLVADITALTLRMKKENQCRSLFLVLGLPFGAIPLVSAHMLHVMKGIVILEYNGDLTNPSIEQTYAELSLTC